ncbi:hypothetical protein [Streptomyces sp. NPDC048350]|uniref:hypothetical protein n=1 Tax=Streptomyces sp. NPDC048350 TaxID=3365538 RepID=UPI0037189107
MRIVLETDDGDEELNAALIAAARRPGTIVAVGDDTWTPDRADEFVRAVHGRGRELLRAVAEGDGWVDGEAYRAKHGENALLGPTASITKAVTKGIREGWLPEGTVLPLTSTYDGRSSWSKTDGYRLPPHLAAIFRDSFDRVYPARRGNPQELIDHLTLLYEEMGRGGKRARVRRAVPSGARRESRRLAGGPEIRHCARGVCRSGCGAARAAGRHRLPDVRADNRGGTPAPAGDPAVRELQGAAVSWSPLERAAMSAQP